MKYKQKKCKESYSQFKVKGLSSGFMLNLRISGENCKIFNWHVSRAAPGISFFGVSTKDDNTVQTGETTLLQLLLVIG